MPGVDHNETRYWRGIQLFNQGAFFDAHEVLEDVWREAPAAEKAFLQGLIQVAVALHHYAKGNLVGAGSLLARGERNLAGYPDLHGGIDLAGLRAAIAGWRDALHHHRLPPELPQLHRVE